MSAIQDRPGIAPWVRLSNLPRKVRLLIYCEDARIQLGQGE